MLGNLVMNAAAFVSSVFYWLSTSSLHSTKSAAGGGGLAAGLAFPPASRPHHIWKSQLKLSLLGVVCGARFCDTQDI